MQNASKLGLFISTIVAFAVGGCAVTEGGGVDETDTGSADMALSADVGGAEYCAEGTIVVSPLGDPGTVLASVATTCDDAGHSVDLTPGDYQLTITDLECSTTISDSGLVGCELDPDPVTFSVSVGVATQLPLALTFFYENGDDEVVVFSAGSVVVSLADPTNVERCGSGEDAPVCASTQVCASLDEATPACFVSCTTTDDTMPNQGSCTEGYQCVPVLGTGDASDPDPVSPGNLEDLNDILHICVPEAED